MEASESAKSLHFFGILTIISLIGPARFARLDGRVPTLEGGRAEVAWTAFSNQ